ncbi:DUF3800 domain-containing protein [Legionella israelensis]|uniref:DUF3800 domain-containing protein n=1 Tax=Legionella israelensis TaxID=454 RepID=UPI003002F490
MKWDKVSGKTFLQYSKFIEYFFGLINDDIVKIRIMFSQNNKVACNLTKEHKEKGYLFLYYQFLKHAFGLQYLASENKYSMHYYLDLLPQKEDDCNKFKYFVSNLDKFIPDQYNLVCSAEQIHEVDSKKSIIIQSVDIVLGAIQAKLNDKFANKNKNKKRPEKTRLKENLYKRINSHIREIYPNFNIGASTSYQNDISNRFRHPYRHWNFEPSDNVSNPHYVSKSR